MQLNRFLCALVGLLALSLAAHAQQPGLLPQGQAYIIYQKPVEQAPAPLAVQPATTCTETVCVTEPKKNTKTVYTSRCKEFCIPSCSFFGSGCGCCEKRTRNVLVKKTVPDCDTTHCVLKEVQAGTCAPCGK